MFKVVSLELTLKHVFLFLFYSNNNMSHRLISWSVNYYKQVNNHFSCFFIFFCPVSHCLRSQKHVYKSTKVCRQNCLHKLKTNYNYYFLTVRANFEEISLSSTCKRTSRIKVLHVSIFAQNQCQFFPKMYVVTEDGFETKFKVTFSSSHLLACCKTDFISK